MNKGQKFILYVIGSVLIVSGGIDRALAVPNPRAILWNAPATDFVRSLYQGVLGRSPSSDADLQSVRAYAQKVTNKKAKRYDLFWHFINSREYQASRWAQQRGEYSIYWKTRNAKRKNGSTYLCHCYYFTKHGSDGGFMPSMQYTGVSYPATRLTFGVAAALTRMYAAYDRETCKLYDCGWGGEQPGGTGGSSSGGLSYEVCRDKYCPDCKSAINLLGQSTSSSCQACIERNRAKIEQCTRGSSTPGGQQGHSSPDHTSPGSASLARDGDFSSFGRAGSPWAKWWISRNAKVLAKHVALKKGGQRNALYVSNRSRRAPHVYGTTYQRIAVQKGRTYRITLIAAARNLNSNGGANVTVDPQWRIRPIHLKKGTYSWTRYSGTFRSEWSHIDLRIISEDIGEVWITGIEVQMLR